MQLGQLFRAQRLRMNLTQAQLSENAQIEMDTIRALEAGKTINEQDLLILAAQLSISRQEIYDAMQETMQQSERAAGQADGPVRNAASREDIRMHRGAGSRHAATQQTPDVYESFSRESRAQAPQQYVSPIPQDEDERLLHEIRRQRRRQAYEGTLRTQRRMQDTARMQEILRQQTQREEQQRRAAEQMQREPARQDAFDQMPPQASREPVNEQHTAAPAYEARSGYEMYPAEDRMPPARQRRTTPMQDYEQPAARPMQESPRLGAEEERYAAQRMGVRTQREPVQGRPVQETGRMRRVYEGHTQPARNIQRPAEYQQQSVVQNTENTNDYIRMLENAADVAQLSGRETVLEIGCDNGRLTQVLASRSRFVAVVDISAYALEKDRAACAANGLTNVDFLEGDARRLPIESGSFDVVYVHMLLHHVVSAPHVLVEAHRVLKPGGCVVITELMPSDVPAQQSVQNAIEVLKNPTHIAVLPMQEVMHMMQYAGLQVADRRVLDQTWEFEQWIDSMGADERMEPLRALMRSFALQGNRAGMDLTVDATGRMTFINRWMYLVGVPKK